MPIDQEVQKQLKSFEEQIGTMKKDFEVKLGVAETEARQWKETAQKSADAIKEFEAKALKSEEERKKALAEARKSEIKSFIEVAVKEARLTPAMAEVATKLMESSTAEGEIHSFTAKDGSKTSHTQFSLLKLFISSLAPHKAFVSMTPASGSMRMEPETKTEHFTEIKRGGQPMTVQVDEYDMDQQAKQFMEEQTKIGKKCSYEDALIEVSRRSKQAA